MKRHPICIAIGSLCLAGLQPAHAQLMAQRPLLEWASEVQVATPAAPVAAATPVTLLPASPPVQHVAIPAEFGCACPAACAAALAR